MAIRNYRDLVAWQRAMDLVEGIYRSSQKFPSAERFGLTPQLRRAGVSIPSNIAEGQGRGGDKEFAHFLRIAYGSLREVETQILIAERLGYQNAEETAELLDVSAEVGRLINGLLKSLGS
jgi:four helix bundle protein